MPVIGCILVFELSGCCVTDASYKLDVYFSFVNQNSVIVSFITMIGCGNGSYRLRKWNLTWPQGPRVNLPRSFSLHSKTLSVLWFLLERQNCIFWKEITLRSHMFLALGCPGKITHLLEKPPRMCKVRMAAELLGGVFTLQGTKMLIVTEC